VRPSLEGRTPRTHHDLRPGQLCSVSRILPSDYCRLKQETRAAEEESYFEVSLLAHCFESWLPLHAAVALGLPLGLVEPLLKAHPPAVATADDNGMLPLAIALSNNACDEIVLRLALTAPAAAGADGRMALHLLAAAPTHSKIGYRQREEALMWQVFKAHPQAAATADRGGKLPGELLGTSLRTDEMATSFATIKLLLPAAPDSKTFASILKRLLVVADFFSKNSGRSAEKGTDVAEFVTHLVAHGISAERLLLATADLALFDAASVLIARHGARGTEASPGDGRCAREVGVRCAYRMCSLTKECVLLL
jgi:hypothetical protein